MFGGNIYPVKEKRDRGQDRYLWSTVGVRSAGIMMALYGFMSPRRKEQIRTALARWKTTPIPRKHRTHCPVGHSYAGENLVIYGHSRDCRTCRLEARKRYNANRRQKRREVAVA